MRNRPVRRLWLRVPSARRGNARPVRTGRNRLWVAAVLGVGLALLAIRLCDVALRPVVTAMAEAKTKNAVTLMMTDAITQTLSSEAISYDDIVTLQKDESGRIVAMSSSSAQMNALRAKLLADITEQAKTLDSNALGIPLGSLTGWVWLSNWGPLLPVRVLTVASADAAFRNLFTSAGINQTQHQVMLDVTVTVKLLLPGGAVEVPVSTQVSVCETIIVGDVPEAYLQFGASR